MNPVIKQSVLFVLLASFALPAASHAAPAHHPAAKKTVRRFVAAPRNAPAPTTAQPAGGRLFSDVPPDHWAAAAVETLRQRGIVVGYPAEHTERNNGTAKDEGVNALAARRSETPPVQRTED